MLLAYNTQGTPLFYPVTIHNFGLYLCTDTCEEVDLTCAAGQWNDDENCTVLNHFAPGQCDCIENEDPKGFCPAYWGATACGYRRNVPLNCDDPGYPDHYRICVCEP